MRIFSLRFSLRGLLALIALVALLIGTRLQYVWRNQRSAAEIAKLGGRVVYDDEAFNPQTWKRGLWADVREMLGLRRPVMVMLQGPKVTDAFLRQHILPLRSLNLLSMENVNISDEALERTTQLQGLGILQCVRDKANLHVLHRLREPAVLEVIEVALPDVLADLGQKHRLRFKLDDATISAANLSKDQTVTCNVKGISVREALDQVLQPLGLKWTVQHGYVVIVPKQYADRRRELEQVLEKALPKLHQLEVD